MQDKIKVSEEIRVKVQRANIEMEGKRGVLAFMITSGTSLEDENYKKYEESYLESFKKFEQEKQEVEKNIVKVKYPNAIKWSLDYTTDEITVDY